MTGDTRFLSGGRQLEVLGPRTPGDPDRTPLLFVHGLGHGAWCWENWQAAAATTGRPAYALSLRGHAGSSGRVRFVTMSQYVADVVAVARTLPRPPVLVGHSMGGLVVQQALAGFAAPAGVLVAPVPAHPAVASLAAIARRHPLDALRIVAGGSLPLRPEYLFSELPQPEAQALSERCGPESAVAQYQLLLHRPSGPPLGGAPVLVLASPDDRLVPIRGVRSTAARYGGRIEEFPGMGHDLMLDARWRLPFDAMLGWLATVPAVR